jgi:multidrug efflux pump subunit AcrB
MKRFNLSGWAVSHPALILFLIVALGAAGFFSYQRLGRAEDPFFTVKVVNVSAIWPGATSRAGTASARRRLPGNRPPSRC